MATLLVAHGAWAGGWGWKKMRPLLRERGHELFTPTYTGIGERVHLAASGIGLGTHIQDVVAVMEYEDLRDIVLIGHSYGGIVATGVRGPHTRARGAPGLSRRLRPARRAVHARPPTRTGPRRHKRAGEDHR